MSSIGEASYLDTGRQTNYDVMESMNGFLERRERQRQLRLDTEVDAIDNMVRNLRADVDYQIEVGNVDGQHQIGGDDAHGDEGSDSRLLQSSVNPYELSMLSQRQPLESSALESASPVNGGAVQEASLEAIFSDNEEANQRLILNAADDNDGGDIIGVGAANEEDKSNQQEVKDHLIQNEHNDDGHQSQQLQQEEQQAKRPKINIFAQKSRSTLSSRTTNSNNIFTKERVRPMRQTRNSEYFGDNDEDLAIAKTKMYQAPTTLRPNTKPSVENVDEELSSGTFNINMKDQQLVTPQEKSSDNTMPNDQENLQ